MDLGVALDQPSRDVHGVDQRVQREGLDRCRTGAVLGRREDLALDPVYTSKTMAALLDLRAAGALGPGAVLYWHTYGPRPTDPG